MILKNTCPVCWIIFFARTASIISWRKIIFFQEASVSKTREFKVYSNREEFVENFAPGKILSAVLIKLQPDNESVYVCYEDKV